MSLDRARALRASNQHEAARSLLVELAAHAPTDAELQYEAACVHDYLGLESQAVPYYLSALAGTLPAAMRRSAYTGLGSTYRTLGMYEVAERTLLEGLHHFPDAAEIKVFLAIVHHNLGRSKVAVESLLVLLARTTCDAQLKAYAPAIEFYAEDIERIWPPGAA